MSAESRTPSVLLVHEGRSGSKWYYDAYGCRCDECKEASRRLRKANRDRARTERRPSYLRELAGARALKQSYRGVCEDCGTETRYNGHGQRVSTRCPACTAKLTGEKLRGRGKVVEALMELLSDGPKRYSEIRDTLGLSSAHAAVHLNRRVKDGSIVRLERGLYAVNK